MLAVWDYLREKQFRCKFGVKTFRMALASALPLVWQLFRINENYLVANTNKKISLRGGVRLPARRSKNFRANLKNKKEIIFMEYTEKEKELRIVLLETRKHLLENRGGNQPILNKINRQLRKLKGE